MTPTFDTMHRPSVTAPETFWEAQARRIHWHVFPECMLDASDPLQPRWFAGGKTNLCYNAVDRHLTHRADQKALVHVCGTSNTERVYTFKQLYDEVNAAASVLRNLGVTQGDRVLLYLPIVPEAVFLMLACTRIGAIHSMVFVGFPADALARRIDATNARVIVTARGATDFSGQLNDALRLTRHRPMHRVYIDSEIDIKTSTDEFGAVHAYGPLRAAAAGVHIPCEWLDSQAPSYILHTSGTTGEPKGVVRDTAGHAVALATSLEHTFGLQAGDVLFSTADLAWVVGHSYGVYAPLIGGLTTVLYAGSPVQPTADALWRVASRHRVNVLLSAPTVMRMIRPAGMRLAARHDLSALRAVVLAGEPLDADTAERIRGTIGKPVIDHYWQTETGSPILASCISDKRLSAAPGFHLSVVDPETGAACSAGQRGVVAIAAPLPPGCLTGLWQDIGKGSKESKGQEAFLSAYFPWPTHRLYSTSDWGVIDAQHRGMALLGRADDAINVAGQRLGTREIEAVLRRDARLADVAVVGWRDALRGQIPVAFVVLDPAYSADVDTNANAAANATLRADLTAQVAAALGKAARPRRVIFVDELPRTRSGKVIRRLLQGDAVQHPGDRYAEEGTAEAITYSAVA